jgi:hypothetical protein
VALTAIVLAGLPASALSSARDALRLRYPDYVVRGAAAPVRGDGMANYDDQEIAKVLNVAAEAVFGSSDRPLGFCQNAQRGCTNKIATGRACERTGKQACVLMKPTRLFLLYQEGRHTDDLLRQFAHAVLPLMIPAETYNRSDATAVLCEAAIEGMKDRAAAIELRLGFGSPLLLPPKAFGRGSAVRDMLNRIANGSDPSKEERQFRQGYYDKPSKAFVGRSDLIFQGAQNSGLHGGTIKDMADPSLALSRRYRLGCHYDGEFHWDVFPRDGSHLAGHYAFDCRETGRFKPKGKYANVLVDDCLRGASTPAPAASLTTKAK